MLSTNKNYEKKCFTKSILVFPMIIRLVFPQLIHTKVSCNGKVCYLQTFQDQRDLDVDRSGMMRRYSKQHGRPERDRRKNYSDSDSDSDTECKGYDRVSDVLDIISPLLNTTTT